MDDVAIIFNPRCSKCRTARGLLEGEGIDAHIIEYLAEPLTVDELSVLMDRLGIGDPRDMMRTGEGMYTSLGLSGKSGRELLGAIVSHPILLERPIVVRGDRAVIARPPERVFELLGPAGSTP